MRLSQAARLRRRAEFDRVAQRGRTVRGRYFLVRVAANEHSGFRLGLAVSRKQGNAVVRNLLRRRIREIARAAMTGSESIDVVVIPKNGAASCAFVELKTDLTQLLAAAVQQCSRS